MFRGDLAFGDLPRELLRRRRAAARRVIERRDLETLVNTPARLSPAYAQMPDAELVRHFADRDVGFFHLEGIADSQQTLFPEETASLIAAADGIVQCSAWELAGFGRLTFDSENYWRTDPLTGIDWGLEYHADVVAYRKSGPDIRVLWELNRFGHAITLARAFAITRDESYAEAYFTQLEDWRRQNPYGRGANWHCAMEVALRAINLLAAFDVFRRSAAMDARRLQMTLKLFDQHGRFIEDNDEFSFVATSNHYLSDVVGLFWIGTMLPELEHAARSRTFGLGEMLAEMDKQVLPDGAHFEASTGYHRLVTEMYLLSFILAKRIDVEIPEKYRLKLRKMLDYLNGIIRPDGRMPLIGDADGSQIVPIVKRDADDASYLLAIGAVVFDELEFKSYASLTPEILWFCGEQGVNKFESMSAPSGGAPSASFSDAASYVMRADDLYLHFNANDCGVNGRGSHAHNDALSVEIYANGRPIIVDAGSYAYNLDREARHMFRSTGYHSTVSVDGAEQNAIDVNTPFIIGNESRPRVLSWEANDQYDRVVAENYGYTPIVHRRTVEFKKSDRYWSITDDLSGHGTHELTFGFHLAPGIQTQAFDSDIVFWIGDAENRGLFIRATGLDAGSIKDSAFVSRNYGHKEPSTILKWKIKSALPLQTTFVLVPCGSSDNREARLELLGRLTDNK